jgi:hypothetical protein
MKRGLTILPSKAQKKRAETALQRSHCAVGLTLHSAFIRQTNEWFFAEAEKRAGVAKLGEEEWRQIARRTDGAKTAHEDALSRYVDHVIACASCKRHVKRRSD